MRLLGEDNTTWRTLTLLILLALATALSCGTIWLGLVALARVQS